LKCAENLTELRQIIENNKITVDELIKKTQTAAFAVGSNNVVYKIYSLLNTLKYLDDIIYHVTDGLIKTKDSGSFDVDSKRMIDTWRSDDKDYDLTKEIGATVVLALQIMRVKTPSGKDYGRMSPQSVYALIHTLRDMKVTLKANLGKQSVKELI